MKSLKPDNKLNQRDVPKKQGISIEFGLMVTNLGVTKHSVNAKGELENGAWLDEEALLSCLTKIQKVAKDNKVKTAKTIQINPTNLLFENDNVICWYQEVAQSFHVFFNADSIPNVPHPRLVFLVKKNAKQEPQSMNVYALDSTVTRPTMDTQLCFAPCANIFRQGNLCLGSATLPKRLTVSELGEAENTLLLSRYTGFKFDAMNLTFEGQTYESCVDVLKSLQNKPSFPDAALRKTGETLGAVLSQQAGGR